MPLLKKINAKLLRIAGVFVTTGMACIAVLVPIDVIGRYITGKMLGWSGELCTFALVWVGMLGAAIGLEKGTQIGVSVVVEKLPKAASRIVLLIGYLFMLYLLSMIVIRGAVQSKANFSQFTSIMGVPMGVPYLAIPIGAALMILVTLDNLLGLFRKPEDAGQ